MLKMDKNVLSWLEEKKDVDIRYRMYKELSEISEIDKELVQSAKNELISSKEVIELLDIINDDVKMQEHFQRFGKFSGYVILNQLGEYGLTRDDVCIDSLAENLINKGFKQACGEPWILRCFVMTGYEEHPKVKQAITNIFYNLNYDNGLKCVSKNKKYIHTNLPKSCMRITASLLLLAAELKKTSELEPQIDKLVSYFLKRGVLFRNDDKESLLYSNIHKTAFPIDPINIGLQSYAYALSKLGYGNNESLEKMWNYIDDKKKEDNTYILDKINKGWIYYNEKPKKSSKWITLYINLAYKYKLK